MHVTWTDHQEFRRRAWDFLLAHEAENNVLFATWSRADAGDPLPAAFGLVERDGELVSAFAIRIGELRLSFGSEDALPAIAASVAARQMSLVGVLAPSGSAEAFAAQWSRETNARLGETTQMTVYQLSQVVPTKPVAGRARLAAEDDLELLTAWSHDFWDHHMKMKMDLPTVVRTAIAKKEAWLWCDAENTPVSMAWIAGYTPNGGRVGPVYTPPEQRHKGYAQAITAALSQHLLDQGRRFCFLLADKADPSANRVYGNLGYRPVGSCAFVRING